MLRNILSQRISVSDPWSDFIRFCADFHQILQNYVKFPLMPPPPPPQCDNRVLKKEGLDIADGTQAVLWEGIFNVAFQVVRSVLRDF